jgi:hypothetical protein
MGLEPLQGPSFSEEKFGKICQKSKVFELGSPVLKSG